MWGREGGREGLCAPQDCTSGQAELVAQGQRQTQVIQTEPRVPGPQRGHWGSPGTSHPPWTSATPPSINKGMDRGAAIFKTMHLSNSSLSQGQVRDWGRPEGKTPMHQEKPILSTSDSATPQGSAFYQFHCKTRTHAKFPPVNWPSLSVAQFSETSAPQGQSPMSSDTP